MRKNGISAFWQKKRYLIAGALIVAAAVGMTSLYSSRQAKERENLEKEIAQEMEGEHILDLAMEPESEQETEAEAASSVIKPEGETEPDSVPETAEVAAETPPAEEDIPQEETVEPPESENTNVKSAGTTAPTLHFAAEDGILWPMEGNVIINYNMESTVYFATLDQYKCSPGVVISGEVNDKVYAVAKGKVTSIENDIVTGTTLTLDLGDGYEAIYGQLKELNFGVGDYVEAGHVLGYINEPTKYYSVEGSNLYFELRKDGDPLDPIEFFE